MSKNYYVIAASTLLVALSLWQVGCNAKPSVPAGNETTKQGHEHQAMQHGATDAHGSHAEDVVGSTRGYTLDVQGDDEVQPNAETVLTMTLRNAQGQPATKFDVVHDKQAHLLLARKDLAHFQHLHPTVDGGKGVMTMEGLTFPAPGEYRLFLDATPAGDKNVVLTHDVSVGDRADAQAEPIAPDSSLEKMFGDTIVRLVMEPTPLHSGQEASLTFELSDAASNEPIKDLQRYLGAWGHLVILRAETLDFLHAHPQEAGGEHAGHAATEEAGSTVTFHTKFERGGVYRVYGQFQRANDLVTAIFTLEVQ